MQNSKWIEGYPSAPGDYYIKWTSNTQPCSAYIVVFEFISGQLLLARTAIDDTPKGYHYNLQELEEFSKEYKGCEYYAVSEYPPRVFRKDIA